MSNNKESNDDNKFSATTTINSNNNNNQAPLPNKKPDLQRFSVSKGKYSSNLNKQQQQQQEEANNNKNSLSKQSMSTVKLKDNKIVDKQFSADQQQSKSFQQKSSMYLLISYHVNIEKNIFLNLFFSHCFFFFFLLNLSKNNF